MVSGPRSLPLSLVPSPFRGTHVLAWAYPCPRFGVPRGRLCGAGGVPLAFTQDFLV